MDNAIRFIDRDAGLVEGLAIPYDGPVEGAFDFYRTRFTPATELHLDWFPNGRPVLYDHGHDAETRGTIIGRQIEAERTDAGVWAKVQLDKANRYAAMIAEMVEAGLMGFSSGALGHLVDVSKRGDILEWPWVELSITPSPANPYALIAGGSRRSLASLDDPDPPAPVLDIDGELRSINDRLRSIDARLAATVDVVRHDDELVVVEPDDSTLPATLADSLRALNSILKGE